MSHQIHLMQQPRIESDERPKVDPLVSILGTIGTVASTVSSSRWFGESVQDHFWPLWGIEFVSLFRFRGSDSMTVRSMIDVQCDIRLDSGFVFVFRFRWMDPNRWQMEGEGREES